MVTRTQARPIALVTVAAVVGLNVLVFGALALAGIPILNSSAGAGSSAADEFAFIPLADAQTVPATLVVREVLGGPLEGIRPAGPVWASSGTPFDKACADRTDPAPVVSYARPFRAQGRVVSVQLSAYGAGQGAAAVAALADRLGDCDGAGTYGQAVGPTSTAVAAWSQSSSSNASTLLWNRADVVASVTVPRTAPGGLAAVAEEVDTALLVALTGTCSSDSETVADAGRSPWSVRPFTGNLEPQPVVLGYADPSASPTPVLPTEVPLVPVPAPTLLAPSLVTPPVDLPPNADAPVPPVSAPFGSAGPVVPLTAAPSPPVAPSAPPTEEEVLRQVADPVGPGCGWAFTRQGAPVFDEAAATERFEAEVVATQEQLQAADANWQQQRSTYSASYATYVGEVESFTAYARAYNAYVANSYSTIYVELLAAYEAARATREAFDVERGAAQFAYDLAVAECGFAGSPTASPAPTDGSIPTATAEPTADPSATATEPAVTCPPEVPEILTAPRPTVPPSPKAPR